MMTKKNAIGRLVCEIRCELEMTQSELAAALGVSQPAIAQWESGKTMPSTHQIGALRRLVGGELGERLLHLI